jgi:hypothetical protein
MGPTRPGPWLPREYGALKLNSLGGRLSSSSFRDDGAGVNATTRGVCFAVRLC